MIYLALCIFLTTSLIILFKLFEKLKINAFQAIIINYLVAAGLGYMNYSNTISLSIITSSKAFELSMITGCMFIIGFSLFALSTQKAGMTITTVASKMSVIIPITAGIFLYKDSLTPVKIIGIIIALFAFYLTLKKQEEFKLAKQVMLFPLFVFFANGIVDTITNAFQKIYQPSSSELSLYLFIVFSTALLIGTTIIFVLETTGKKHFSKWTKHLIAGLIVGILNYYATWAFMQGVGIIATSIFIPLLNVGIVALSTITGYIIFKEHLSKINWIGIVLSIIAILIISQS